MEQHEVDAGQVIAGLQRQIADQALVIATQQAMIEKMLQAQPPAAKVDSTF